MVTLHPYGKVRQVHMEHFGKRIRSERVEKGWTQDQMATIGGVTVQTQGRYEKGKRAPDLQYLAALNREGVDVQYIVNGYKSALLAERRSGRKSESSVRVGEPNDGSDGWCAKDRDAALTEGVPLEDIPLAMRRSGTLEEEFLLVPRMDIQVSGGHGALVSSEQVVDHLAFRQDWLKEKGLNPDDLALVEIIGDSMEPKLGPGDTVLIDTSQSKIRGGSAYVVRIGEDLVVKYLQLIPGEQIQVSSENPSYPPYTISKEQMDGEFMVIGKVVASNHEWR